MSRHEEFAAELSKHTGLDFKPGSYGGGYGPAATTQLETGHQVHVGPDVDVPGGHKIVAFDDYHFTKPDSTGGSPQVFGQVVSSNKVVQRTGEILRSQQFMGSIRSSIKDRHKDMWDVLHSDYAATKYDPDVEKPEYD